VSNLGLTSPSRSSVRTSDAFYAFDAFIRRFSFVVVFSIVWVFFQPFQSLADPYVKVPKMELGSTRSTSPCCFCCSRHGPISTDPSH
jgi:hypothetical protein